MIREYTEWPQRLERVCREAKTRWRAAHPWTPPCASPCRYGDCLFGNFQSGARIE
jgi:hypothetical protein